MPSWKMAVQYWTLYILSFLSVSHSVAFHRHHVTQGYNHQLSRPFQRYWCVCVNARPTTTATMVHRSRKRELFSRSPLALPDHRHSTHHPHPGSALATSSQPSTLRYTPADIHRDPSTRRHFGSTQSETSSPDESRHPETITGVLCSFRQIYTEAIDILDIASTNWSKNALGCSGEDTRALPLLGVYQSAAGIRGQLHSVRDSLVDSWRLHTSRAGHLNTVIIGMQHMISQ